jgi:hypothetical protein
MLTNVTLAVERGPQAGAACHLDAPATCVIGSASDTDFPVIGAVHPLDVARRQCRIEVSPTGARICDLGSPSGTLVNGKPIVCLKEDALAQRLQMSTGVELADGDHVAFGGVVLTVVLTTDLPKSGSTTKTSGAVRRAIAGVLSC